MPQMRVIKVKPYTPWYKATKNKQLGEVSRIDVDRQGNLYQLRINLSVKPDGEKVEDVIRVRHLGKLETKNDDALTALGFALFMDLFHPRAFISGDIDLVVEFLKEDTTVSPDLISEALERITRHKEKHNA